VTALREIVWTSKHHAADVTHPSGDEARVSKRTDANRNVETLFDHIQIAIGKHEFHLDTRVVVEKAPDQRSNVPAAKQSRRRNTQEAA
jgi:hypothetical protein